jgi:hypothetical protein
VQIPIIVTVDRTRMVALGVGLTLLTIAVLLDSVAAGAVIGVVALPAASTAIAVAVRDPWRLTISTSGIQSRRVGAYAWSEIGEIACREYQASYGLKHELLLYLSEAPEPEPITHTARDGGGVDRRRPNSVAIPLDGLRPGWATVVDGIERMAGMEVRRDVSRRRNRD